MTTASLAQLLARGMSVDTAKLLSESTSNSILMSRLLGRSFGGSTATRIAAIVSEHSVLTSSGELTLLLSRRFDGATAKAIVEELLALENAALGGNGGDDLAPPPGFLFLVDGTGAYLIDGSGAYLVVPI